ncbi:ATP-dependent Clp protease ATP-binding subunit [Blattabacterium cuenoti]|uniref:ATP-dependent Clp protease ATP-binding subunit n=1 Tax=Blattabacterium cuenoti TaxID=1653831 RepID=UPI001EEB658B|nr:ATP-dependent Clp protease ATP-binding subunit [Blattabacterium cuenoti]
MNYYSLEDKTYSDGDAKNDNSNSYESEKNKYNSKYYNNKKTSIKSKTPILDHFGNDLNALAINGELDPLVGRDKEVERISQILSRRKKNNPILIGEPGVGKTAIAEGLALRIFQRKVSRVLYNKRIIILDLSSLVAGTKYRGQFEERMKSIINEAESSNDLILFIDELHTLIGSGGSTGSLDASNIFKPALAKGKIQCIGATTFNEYKQYIEKDGALERRFQKIFIYPSSENETIEILQKIKNKYENHHNVIYTKEAIKACVKLTSRYIVDRFLPDKAIDALDESGSRVYIKNIKVPKEIIVLEKELENIRKKKSKVVKNQKYEEAAKLRDHEKNIENKLLEAQKNWEKFSKKNKEIVYEENVEKVVSMMSGIPINRIAKSEIKKFNKMVNSIKEKIIGQDEAVEKIVQSIQRNRIGMKDSDSPIGSFIFLGKTGVGKTYLSRIFSKELFNSEESLIRIDMSEYQESHSISKLIGAPPGYIGYEEGGRLTEAIRRRPYSIILLDEIEKAHRDIFHILLQILDYGFLTDNSGKKINFRNTIIIFTSNIGIQKIKSNKSEIGFKTKNNRSNIDHKKIIKESLQKSLSSEFLNRIDDIIVFNSLKNDDINKIIILELNEIILQVQNLGYKLVIFSDVRKFIKKKGYDYENGVRLLKITIKKYIKNPISECIINGNLKTGNKISLKMNSKKNKIETFITKK